MSKGMTRDMTAKNLWKIGLFHDTFITKTGRQNRKNMQKMPVSNDEEVINVTKHVIYTSMLFV